jgi:hypothetical protein
VVRSEPLKNRSEPRINSDAATKHEYARLGFQTWMGKGRNFIHPCKSVFICGSLLFVPHFTHVAAVCFVPRSRRKDNVALQSDLLSPIENLDIFVLTSIGAIGQSGTVE